MGGAGRKERGGGGGRGGGVTKAKGVEDLDNVVAVDVPVRVAVEDTEGFAKRVQELRRDFGENVGAGRCGCCCGSWVGPDASARRGGGVGNSISDRLGGRRLGLAPGKGARWRSR